MNGFLLLVLFVGLMAACQWRDRRRLRAAMEVLGHRVASIRWLPLGQFEAANLRKTLVYEVVSDGPDGTRWRARVACPLLTDPEFLARDEVDARGDAPPGPGAGSTPPVIGPRPADAEPGGRKSARLAILAAIACLATVGVPYWGIPYRQIQLPTSLLGPGVAVTALAAAVLHWRQPRRWLLTLAVTAGAIVAVVALRIVADVLRDPTSHNLFPFELAIAAFVGVAAAGVGLGVGSLGRKVGRQHDTR